MSPEVPTSFFVFFGLLFGLFAGSFANVCIHRLPLGGSVVRPRSRCPVCATPIAARDNVPVLSWLLLGARCRACRAPIPWRYPAVELAAGALFAGTIALHGPGLPAVSGCILSAAALILAFTDAEHRILPDEITLGALALGLALALGRDLASPPERWLLGHLAESVAGAVLGAAALLAVRGAYQWLRGVEGMGEGDVTMTAMVGAFVGPSGVLLLLFVASAAGAVVGGAAAALRRLSWSRSLRRARADAAAARSSADLLIAPDWTVLAASRTWLDIPGAAPCGARLAASGPVARPLVAFARLARRRAARGLPTELGRLPVEEPDGPFFRMLAVHAEAVAPGLYVLAGRADVPFGVFLALASIVVHAWGRPALAVVFGGSPPLGPLLP